MEILETEKLTLQAVDETHLKLTIFTDGEITKDDIPPVIEFMDQYHAPTPVLLVREGSYILSLLVLIALRQEAKRRIKAMAFIDRNHKETILTKIAKQTYMKDARVKSFDNEQDALDWLAQFGNLPTNQSPGNAD